MEALEGLKQIGDESIDLIVTDPPYGIDYKSNHGSKKYKKKIQDFNWDKDFDFTKFFDELYRVMKQDTFMYVFGRHENTSNDRNVVC